MKYAGFWRRAAAIVIDAIIINAVNAVVFAVIMMELVTVSPDTDLDTAWVVFSTVRVNNMATLVFFWLYFAWMESSAQQATLGKMLVGILVTDIRGNRISFGRACGRCFVKWISAIILMIGYLMAAFTERKQALHDIMAGCLVICKPPKST